MFATGNRLNFKTNTITCAGSSERMKGMRPKYTHKNSRQKKQQDSKYAFAHAHTHIHTSTHNTRSLAGTKVSSQKEFATAVNSKPCVHH